MARGKLSNSVPFGKYAGQPIEDLLADPAYMLWMSRQPAFMTWLKRAQPTFHDMLTGMRKSEDSAEHNKLQARFLNAEFQLAFLSAMTGKHWQETAASMWKVDRDLTPYLDHMRQVIARLREQVSCHPNYGLLRDELRQATAYHAKLCNGPPQSNHQPPDIAVSFEHGYDVRVQASWHRYDYERRDLHNWGHIHLPKVPLRLCPIVVHNKDARTEAAKRLPNQHETYHVEIKPMMGGDFPQVLREARRHGTNVVLVDQFEAEGVTWDEVTAMFSVTGTLPAARKTEAVAPIRMLKLAEVERWLSPA